MQRALPVAAVVVLACAAATIASVASAASTPARARPKSPPLRGTNWVLTDRVSIGTPLQHVAVDAVFGAERVTGTSGCNGYSSSYRTTGSRMTITNDGVSTQIACAGAAGKVEAKYLPALERVGRWRIRGADLTLSTRTGRRLLVFRASIGTAALHATWKVTNFFTGSTVSSPIPGTTLTLKLADGRASGRGGCNTFDGPFEVSGVDRIALGPLVSPREACADPELDRQEQQYLAALQLAKTYRVTGDTLTFSRAGGTVAATLERGT